MAEEKKCLREKFSRLRKNLTKREREQLSKIIKKNLFSMEEFKKSKVIMFFVSFKSEVNTIPMIKETIKLGKRVVVPLVIKKKKSLVAIEIKDPDKDLSPGEFGILEPKDSENPVNPKEIDLVLVPGLVFDKYGYRIGYGGGYYDNWLKYFNKNKRIGLAFSLQVIEDKIPISNHDLPVNKIVTDKAIISPQKGI
jgi:5-formyltetrahydrofolate cyclo-ligase